MEKSADAALILHVLDALFLHVPEALILAIGTYEKTLPRQLEWHDGNNDILRRAWGDMHGLCADRRDHSGLQPAHASRWPPRSR
ncbi:hypothetical protein [Streptomyces sp. NPDC057429]|uniref:hypothetical protein n=1 Tax=Streptomyces sp. NPDC057429 TaxID=3346130 RepID=UPI00369F97B5